MDHIATQIAIVILCVILIVGIGWWVAWAEFEEMEDEPQGCPFCGHDAEVRARPIGSRMTYWVSCANTECVKPCTAPKEHREEAVRQWNRRSPMMLPAHYEIW